MNWFSKFLRLGTPQVQTIFPKTWDELVADAQSRDGFARDLAAQMDLELQRWREFGFDPIRRRWLAAAHPIGAALVVHDNNGSPVSGEFGGLEEDGALRLRLADGAIRAIRAGDVMLGEG